MKLKLTIRLNRKSLCYSMAILKRQIFCQNNWHKRPKTITFAFMFFKDIVGLSHVKAHLERSLKLGRIPHAQLFAGNYGYGGLSMALALAREIITGESTGEKRRICDLKISNFAHPDLHFVYPVNNSESMKLEKPVSKYFAKEWKAFVSENPFAGVFDWYKFIGIEKKQGLINRHEASEINKNLSLKSFEGNAKVMIIWSAEKMNSTTANKLLKLIEEPPEKTYFILLSEHPEQLLQTIYSRCQVVEFPPLSNEVIASYLQEHNGIEASVALQVAFQADGNMANALELLDASSDRKRYEKWFITWVRAAFRAKGNKAVVKELIAWSEVIAKENRETQKNFLAYCIQFFRQALLANYQAHSLVFMETYDEGFKFDKFATFVHGNNIQPIFEALEKATYYVERNANGKIVFTDLSLQLTRLIHA